MTTTHIGRRSLLDASRCAVLTLRGTIRDMRNDECAIDLIDEVAGVLADLERALAGDGAGLHIDARPSTLAD